MLTAEKIRELLHLRPHPIEGGYFVETYRSKMQVAPGVLGSPYLTPRLIGTAIFYLLTPDTFSAMHKLPGDELFHFYLGDPVEMLQLMPDGAAQTIRLGHDISAGMQLQYCVPGGCWQGSRLIPSGAFALLGTTMSPGFDYGDYAVGDREILTSQYPAQAATIAALTRA
jgi:hypothetical protein